VGDGKLGFLSGNYVIEMQEMEQLTKLLLKLQDNL
jgi:hypothetical protein